MCWSSFRLLPPGQPVLICTEIAGETIVRRIFRNLDDGGRRELLVQCAAGSWPPSTAPTGPGLTPAGSTGAVAPELDAMGDTTATFSGRFVGWTANRPALAPTWCTAISGWAT